MRDKNGRVKRGSRAINPAGGDVRLARLKNQLDQLTPRAIARLGQLIESDSEQVALGAVKEVLDRNLGKPKASLDVKVEASLSALHLQALEELAARQAIARDARMIDVTPAATASPMPSVIEAMDYSDGKG
jgi:formate dehydrogenase maturation protein FdhE